MNEIDNTVERIGQLPDGVSMRNWSVHLECTTDDLKALATAYTKAVADLATERNGADDLRAEVAEFKSIEWLLSRRPIFDDCKTTYDKVAKMLSVCGQADKILANFAQNAIKPKDAETSGEGTE